MGLCSGVASFEYAAPHWKDDDNDVEITPPPQGADRRYPIAYTRAATVTIDQFVPALTMDHRSDPPTKIYYKAIGPGGQEFTIGRTDENQPIAAPEPLENTIAYHANYPLSWKVSFDGQHVWYDIGSTGHEMYVTLDTPFGQRYETMYHIATTTGHGVNDPDIALERIWDLFETRSVPNKSGETMGYYRGAPCADPRDENGVQVLNAAQLLSVTNGQCDAWVQLFVNTVRVHGQDATGDAQRIVVRPDPNAFPFYACSSNIWQSRMRFMINDWLFDQFALSGCPTFPYRINYSCDIFWSPWPDVDVFDLPGVAGQDMHDPQSAFEVHVLAVVKGSLYDPSYGRGPYTSVRDWEESSVAGFASTINLLNDGLHGARPNRSDWREVVQTQSTPVP